MPLFLKPIFLDKVWGSDNLRQFGYQLPNNHIGECWGISAHPHGKSVIENGIYLLVKHWIKYGTIIEKYLEIFQVKIFH